MHKYESTNNELALGIVEVVLRNLQVELHKMMSMEHNLQVMGHATLTGAGPLRIRPAEQWSASGY